MGPFVFLLDTNILSDVIRRPAGPVAQWIAHHGENTICTSIIVACELRFGAAKKGVVVLTAKVEQLLDRLAILPFGDDADRHYAALRVHLEKAGTLVGPNDMLIAAHALAHDLTLVTGNVAEFSRVPGLRVENWLDTL